MLATESGVALSDLAALRARAQQLGPRRVAVVCAEDEVAIGTAFAALDLNIATPVFIGDRDRIESVARVLGAAALLGRVQIVRAADAPEAAAIAARMAGAGEVDILLKGHLRTDELLHAVLDKQFGLRTGRLLSDILIYEDTLSGTRRLVGVTDGGINVLPTLEQKQQIIQNAVQVMHALGRPRPRIALLSATEIVSPALPSTVEARQLTQMAATGAFGECEVFGPLALDNALLESTARAKGITSPVAGHADVIVLPNLEAGNVFGKAVKYFGGSQCAHVVVGARVPVLIPSRVESVDDKLNSVALGVLACAR